MKTAHSKKGDNMKKKFLFTMLVSLCVFLSENVCADEKRFDVPLADSPTIGPADAPVTIMEFLDYQ